MNMIDRPLTIQEANERMRKFQFEGNKKMDLELQERLKKEADTAIRQNSELKSSLRDLYNVVKHSLLVLDWTVKVGVVAAVWFLPMPQDRKIQAIAMIAYAVLVTLISKGIHSLKAIQEKISH